MNTCYQLLTFIPVPLVFSGPYKYATTISFPWRSAKESWIGLPDQCSKIHFRNRFINHPQRPHRPIPLATAAALWWLLLLILWLVSLSSVGSFVSMIGDCYRSMNDPVIPSSTVRTVPKVMATRSSAPWNRSFRRHISLHHAETAYALWW